MRVNKIHSKYKVPNLERALEIIELLKDHPGGLTMSEIAQRIGASPTSIFRISMTMIERGFFVRDEETKRVRMSGKLFSISSVGACEKNLSEIAAAGLRELRNATKETSLLGVLVPDTGCGVSVLQYASLHPFKFVQDIGAPIILHAGAPGKALLAFQPPDEQAALLKRLRLIRYTAHTITSRRALRKELDQVRAQGFALGIGEWMDEINGLAAPVLDRFDHAAAVVWIAGPSSRLTPEYLLAMADTVTECARKVSAILRNEG